MRKSNRGLSIDASCKMFLYLAIWFQRSRGSKIDQPEKELPMVAIFVNRSGRNEHIYRSKTFHKYFLPRSSLFG
jgi:hypothetical protein